MRICTHREEHSPYICYDFALLLLTFEARKITWKTPSYPLLFLQKKT